VVGQDNAGQGRVQARQGKAGQGKARQSRARQGRAEWKNRKGRAGARCKNPLDTVIVQFSFPGLIGHIIANALHHAKHGLIPYLHI